MGYGDWATIPARLARAVTTRSAPGKICLASLSGHHRALGSYRCRARRRYHLVQLTQIDRVDGCGGRAPDAETGEKISDRVKLLYDPLYAIVGIASQVPEINAPLGDNGRPSMTMLLRVLRFYPQILSLYVGLDNGDYFGVTRIAGEARARFRDAFKRAG